MIKIITVGSCIYGECVYKLNHIKNETSNDVVRSAS